MKQLILITSFILTIITTTFAQNDLSLTITGIRNTKGTVRIAIFNSANGFPDDSKKAYKTLYVKSGADNITTVINGLPTGKYAIIVFHDENDNKKLDTNMFGMPKEGTGTSNAKDKSAGKPSFEKAVFDVNAKTQNISITLFY